MIGKQFGLFGLREDIKHAQSNLLGRIVAVKNDGYEMMTNQGIRVVSGTLHLGDFIQFTEKDHTVQIERVIPAHSKLTLKGEVVTNVDTVVLTIGSERTDLSEVEDVLNHVWDSGALPVIALVNPTTNVSRELLMNVRQIAAFVDIYVVDPTNDGAQLKRVFKENKTTLLYGSTNAVKEYLLKRLFGDAFTLADQTVFEYGGMAIMTINREDEAINPAEENAFQDIEDLIARCRFSDCTHTNEPGCQIIKDLETGTLSYDHYMNYLASKGISQEEESIDDEDEDIHYHYRRKDRDKSKFTKKNNKDKEELIIY